MRVLIVDDEALARSRLQNLLEDAALDQSAAGKTLDFAGLAHMEIAQAPDAVQAIALLHRQPFDVLFLDVHMPGATGLQLARELQSLNHPPLLIFVSAHAEHALQAFELDALDYLSKPVTASRLEQTLGKIARLLPGLSSNTTAPNEQNERVFVIQERGRVLRLPISQVLYLRAELKYLTVRTLDGSHLLEGSLNEMEHIYGHVFLRTHRSALVAKKAIVALEKQHDGDEEGWAVRLQGIPELLPVSRRQLASVKLAIRS